MASAAQRRIKSISYAKYGYIFILPFFLVYFFFQLWPLINTFSLSFRENDEKGAKFVGMDNYKAILFETKVDDDVAMGKAEWLKELPKEERVATIKAEQSKTRINEQHRLFSEAFKNTLILWFGNFIPQIILSLSLAVWFTDAMLKIPGKGFFKVIMYMPNIITAACVAVLFTSLCQESRFGALQQIFHSVGIIDGDIQKTNYSDWVKLLNGEWESRIVVMFIQTWMWFGNTMIMLMSGIMGINPSLFEAASIDGASSGQVFRKITLPLLSPIMVYTLVTSMIGGLQMFDIPYLYHDKGNQKVTESLRTVAVYIYGTFNNLEGNKNYGWAGAASVCLFLVTLALGSVTFYLNRDKDAIAKKKQRKKLAQQAKIKNKQFGGLSI